MTGGRACAAGRVEGATEAGPKEVAPDPGACSGPVGVLRRREPKWRRHGSPTQAFQAPGTRVEVRLSGHL